MATVRLVCPHCGRIDRLSITQPLEFYEAGYRREWLSSAPSGGHHYEAICGMKCHLCGGWCIGAFSADGINGAEVFKGGPTSNIAIEGSRAAVLVAVYPPPQVFSAHDAVPENARVFFIEAQEDLQSGRAAAGIISKCRSVLDLCLKELRAEGAGRKARIADLRSKGLLTQSLGQWADQLWDDGNDAIHDLTGDHERARQHVTFLELFFEVAFALPAQVQSAQTPVHNEP
jgi:hypothetical protein